MKDTLNTADLDAVATTLRSARRVAVLTGAGVSADSGLPTYRGVGGLYNGMEIEAGLPIEEILHAYTMARNPALTWKYIAQIERACRSCGPNQAHTLLAAWQDRFDVRIVTQNIDGFHLAAGSREVIELHGNLEKLYCCDCLHEFSSTAFDLNLLPPRCPHCDGLVRPRVVLFGELLPPAAVAAYERELARGFDVMFVIGTSALFPYLQDPVVEARARGCITVEINLDRTVLSDEVSYRLVGGARATLERINALLESA